MPLIVYQQIYTPETKHQLYNQKMYSKDLERIEAYPYHFIASSQGDPTVPLIWISGTSRDLLPPDRNETINDCLKQIASINFDSILFLLTVYPVIPFTSFKEFIHSNCYLPIPDPFKQLFAKSYGYLLYNYQLEQLYSMVTDCNYMEAIAFRKDWNRKLPAARDIAASILINNKLSVSDLIMNLTPDQNDFVYIPNFNAAYRLWQKFESEEWLID